METMTLPQMLLIAGTGRNSGKTTLACRIISKFSKTLPLVAVKVTPHFHKIIPGGKVIINERHLYIGEETNPSSGKDSSRMLAAGAHQSFFVMTTDEYLGKAISRIITLIAEKSLLVCESGGLRHWVIPGLFLMMNRPGQEEQKSCSTTLKSLADRLIAFDGREMDFDLQSIKIINNRWSIR
jgi:hypothetical protein